MFLLCLSYSDSGVVCIQVPRRSVAILMLLYGVFCSMNQYFEVYTITLPVVALMIVSFHPTRRFNSLWFVSHHHSGTSPPSLAALRAFPFLCLLYLALVRIPLVLVRHETPLIYSFFPPLRWNNIDEKVVEEFELPQLTKLQTNIPKAEDIQWCGFLEQYDEQYDRITSRTEKRLQASQGQAQSQV